METNSNVTIIRGGPVRRSIFEIPRALMKNRRLLFSLGKNDFKQKFAGSYLGIIWAFVQPIITVLVYWFVFQMALNVGSQSTKGGLEVPYILWLLAGLVPWFFFNDAVSSASGALLDYDYLVKKVVFEVSILPVVKIFSALFVHVFFVSFTLVIYCAYGYFPTLYTLQILYYFVAMAAFSLGIVYITSAMVVLFRDIKQVITIILQVLVWMTPIMWNVDAMIEGGRISRPLAILLKLNPMFYVVNGYRDSLINHVWFFEHGPMTIYFWVVTALMFVIGAKVFMKLQVHFADVL